MKRSLFALFLALAASLSLVIPAGAVVGGIDAIDNPGVVSFWTPGTFTRNRCTGTLIDDGTPVNGSDLVLTAAHCVYPLTYPGNQPSTARIGSVDNSTGAAYTEYTISQYFVRSDYNDLTWSNDLMVVRLNAQVPPSVETPARWNLPPIADHTLGTVQGYGWTCDGPPLLDCSTWYHGPLQRMVSKVVPDAECPAHMTDPGRKVCFTDAHGNNAMACPGDSGGPMFTKDALGRFEVRIAIVGDADDWAAESCTTAPDGGRALGMGTDVSFYRFWIADVIAGNVTPFDPSTIYPPGCCPPIGRSAAVGLPWGMQDFELVG